MSGCFCIDAGSVGTTGESGVWRGSKLFFGRGSGKFCGEVSGSDSNRFLVFFRYLCQDLWLRICQGRLCIFHTSRPLIRFVELVPGVGESVCCVKVFVFIG